MTTTRPNWQDLDWRSIGKTIGLERPIKAGDKLLFQSVVYGLLTLQERYEGRLTVDVTELPGFGLPKRFELNDSLRSTIKIPYLQDGLLIPGNVMAYRLECALQGRDIDLQHGMTTTGLRATPAQIRLLKAGTIIEVVQDRYYFEEKEPTIKVGRRLTVICLEIGSEEYEDGANLGDTDLENIDLLDDVVWAWDVWQVHGGPEEPMETRVTLKFSDFVIAAEQTLEVESGSQ